MLKTVGSTQPEASAIEPVRTISRRKQAILDHAEGIAPTREQWRTKNKAYYDDDLNYMRFLVPEGARVLDLGCGAGTLLAGLKPSRGVGIDFSEAMVAQARRQYPDLEFYVGDVENLEPLKESIGGPFDYVVMSDTIGFLDDCQSTLEALHAFCDHETRIVIAYYSQLWEPVLQLGEAAGLKMPQPEVNFLGARDIESMLSLADFEPIKVEWRQLLPKRWLGLGTLVNRYIGTLPLVRKLCLRHYVVARSARHVPDARLSVTVVIPCRNEKGNIESAIKRMPHFADDMEILYVEGNSSDGTFEECERVRDAYRGQWDIKAVKQRGEGIRSAVLTGFTDARGDVLMTLDGDLTVPPEELPKFYDAVVRGKGEYVSGTRLVYPMEQGAMRLLNYWANRTFARAFSFLLNQRFTDTLCGTKAMTKRNFEIISAQRPYFEGADPYGNFDLFFAAAKANMTFLEIPIRYADRTYGKPQISRFRDGWKLLRAVGFAWRKMKAI
jgi:SAM-dependent methyltransferase